MNAWAKVEELRTTTESFFRIIHGPKEAFTVTDFFLLLRLISVVNRMISNPEVKQIFLSESLASENAIQNAKG